MGTDKVADDATRAAPIDFDATDRWFTGPTFLRSPKPEWPREHREDVPATGEERTTCAAADRHQGQGHPDLPQYERFSKWTRLLRATA